MGLLTKFLCCAGDNHALEPPPFPYPKLEMSPPPAPVRGPYRTLSPSHVAMPPNHGPTLVRTVSPTPQPLNLRFDEYASAAQSMSPVVVQEVPAPPSSPTPGSHPLSFSTAQLPAMITLSDSRPPTPSLHFVDHQPLPQYQYHSTDPAPGPVQPSPTFMVMAGALTPPPSGPPSPNASLNQTGHTEVVQTSHVLLDVNGSTNPNSHTVSFAANLQYHAPEVAYSSYGDQTSGTATPSGPTTPVRPVPAADARPITLVAAPISREQADPTVMNVETPSQYPVVHPKSESSSQQYVLISPSAPPRPVDAVNSSRSNARSNTSVVDMTTSPRSIPSSVMEISGWQRSQRSRTSSFGPRTPNTSSLPRCPTTSTTASRDGKLSTRVQKPPLGAASEFPVRRGSLIQMPGAQFKPPHTAQHAAPQHSGEAVLMMDSSMNRGIPAHAHMMSGHQPVKNRRDSMTEAMMMDPSFTRGHPAHAHMMSGDEQVQNRMSESMADTVMMDPSFTRGNPAYAYMMSGNEQVQNRMSASMAGAMMMDSSFTRGHPEYAHMMGSVYTKDYSSVGSTQPSDSLAAHPSTIMLDHSQIMTPGSAMLMNGTGDRPVATLATHSEPPVNIGPQQSAIFMDSMYHDPSRTHMMSGQQLNLPETVPMRSQSGRPSTLTDSGASTMFMDPVGLHDPKSIFVMGSRGPQRPDARQSLELGIPGPGFNYSDSLTNTADPMGGIAEFPVNSR
uniref:Uncharacterized protein n=1 Tax=Eutreptiella gymnastica TaxID=73025 RepID=A0A7S1IMF5_9EUGL|mmetsp:Transcript_2727/g.4891  ORF Transcript_2727/g.4891 Transcript_2727/m.4891 type:complete len:728 (+) Transcript_2727:83-2266(+)